MGKRGDKQMLVIRNNNNYIRRNEYSECKLNHNFCNNPIRSHSPSNRLYSEGQFCCPNPNCCPDSRLSPAEGWNLRRSRSSSIDRKNPAVRPVRSPQRRNNYYDVKSGCSTCSSCDTCSLSDYSSQDSCCSFGSSDSIQCKDLHRGCNGRNDGHFMKYHVTDAYLANGAKLSRNRSGIARDVKVPPRRTRSFNDCSLLNTDYFTAPDVGISDRSPIRNGRHRDGRHFVKDPKSPPSASPLGLKGHRTETSSGVGTSISGGSQQAARPRKTNNATRKQTELISKMVNQTEHHRKQIRTLKSELDRLRITGDSLAMCEVNQKDVEWRPANIVGEGSFSTVYKGVFLGTEVAIKELRFKLSQDDKNYFRSEAALLQQLHHPRVVLLMGVCASALRPFMILEFLSGGTLHNLVHFAVRDPLDHTAYFSIAKDIAQGMTFLHKHEPQVLHLDLKSMNVLLDSYSRAKIADFGFSILRRRQRSYPPQKESIRGTPAYMAPELLTKGEVSVKCDVYSYAIILWEMLTGTMPFQGMDIFQIMEGIENGLRPALPRSNISQELRELISSCWAQSLTLRPNFEEILSALESASLPTAWRNVLHKANISPSSFSDWKTARKIINMIERSVEFLEQDCPKEVSKRHLSARPQDRNVDPHRRNRSSSPIKRRSPTKHDDLIRYANRRNDFKNNSLLTQTTSGQRYAPVVRSNSPSKRRAPMHPMDDHREYQNYRREPRKSPTRRIQDSRNGLQPRRYSDESDTAYSSDRRGSTSRQDSSDEERKHFWVKKSHQSERTSCNDATPLRKSPKRYRSPERGRRTETHKQRGYAPAPKTSPKRNSPKKAEVAPYGAIALTAEQLLSQKQRLRPVRPSQLRQLADLPQSSINNISSILKQAMDQRRHALDRTRSKNSGDYSEWY